MRRQDHIREFAAKALTDGRIDYFIGWKQGHNASEVDPGVCERPGRSGATHLERLFATTTW